MTDDLYCSTDGRGNFENNISKILSDISTLQNKDLDQDARLEALELLDIAEVITKSNNALLVANGIDAKATLALSTASTADGKVNGAVADAANAVITSGDALSQAATAFNISTLVNNKYNKTVLPALQFAIDNANNALSASSTAVSDAAAAVITANAADGKADIAVYDSNVAVVKVNKAIITDAQTLTTGQKAQARANIGTLKIEDSNYAYEVIFNILTQTGFMILPIRQSYVLDISKYDPFRETLIEEGKGYIYVPDNLLATYKTAWTLYADRIFGLTALTEVPAKMFKDNLLITSYPYKPTKIGGTAFRNCNNLSEIDLSDISTLGDYGLCECHALRGGIVIKDSINLEYSSLFRCGLKTIDLHKVVRLVATCLSRCPNLTTLILRNDSVAILDNITVLEETPIANGTGYIYVPDALVDAYKIATNWVIFAAQIKGISELP